MWQAAHLANLAPDRRPRTTDPAKSNGAKDPPDRRRHVAATHCISSRPRTSAGMAKRRPAEQ
eukprot:7119137-Pyramimonas_sp.AAC.1